MKMERLQKAMAEAGVASRRASEKLIAQGHVKVNGKLVTELGTKVSSSDQVTVDGVPLEREQPISRGVLSRQLMMSMVAAPWSIF